MAYSEPELHSPELSILWSVWQVCTQYLSIGSWTRTINRHPHRHTALPICTDSPHGKPPSAAIYGSCFIILSIYQYKISKNTISPIHIHTVTTRGVEMILVDLGCFLNSPINFSFLPFKTARQYNMATAIIRPITAGETSMDAVCLRSAVLLPCSIDFSIALRRTPTCHAA